MLKKLIDSSLFRSAGLYTVTNIINSAIPFFMLPIMTRFLTPTDYGIVAMFSVLVGIVSPFLGMSIHGAIARKYFDKEEIDFPKYIGNCLFILIASFILVSFVFCSFPSLISKYSSFPREWLWTVLIISFSQFLIQVVLALWQVRVKPFIYGIFQISQTLVNISLSIWLVVKMHMGWQGRIEAQIITSCLFGLIGIFILYKQKWVKFSFNFSYMKDALKFGVPLIPHALGGYAITMTDRIFITNMVGISETGIYTVGYQIGSVVALLVSAFVQAWVPWLYSNLKLNDDKIKLKIVKFTYVFFVGSIFFVMGIAWIAPWFLKFFLGKNFLGSINFIFWIALGYAFDGMYKMVAGYIFYMEKTYILAWITFLSAIINIAFNYVFISLYGAIGASQATALSYFLIFILTWIYANSIYKMPWSLKVKK